MPSGANYLLQTGIRKLICTFVAIVVVPDRHANHQNVAVFVATYLVPRTSRYPRTSVLSLQFPAKTNPTWGMISFSPVLILVLHWRRMLYASFMQYVSWHFIHELWQVSDQWYHATWGTGEFRLHLTFKPIHVREIGGHASKLVELIIEIPE